MKSWKTAVWYGLAVWAIPFFVALSLTPLRYSQRTLFESIMPVVVAIAAVIFTDLYMNQAERRFLREGILLGTTWFALSVVIDLLMFSSGTMEITPIEYVKDIGVMYLLIPTITVGFGVVLEQRMTKRHI